MAYKFNKSNWAEDEIIRLSDFYGDGEYVKFVCLDSDGETVAQHKNYGKYLVAYPDIENKSENKGRLLLLIEVKSRREFYKHGGFLALKQRSFNSYDIVQRKEKVPVKIVYFIGDKDNYEIFWCRLSEIKKMETHREMFQDANDKNEEAYIFFHSEQLSQEMFSLFDIV